MPSELASVPQTELPHALVGFEPLEKAWNILGMSPAAYSPGKHSDEYFSYGLTASRTARVCILRTVPM